jgi:hypothetical protein
MKQTMLQRLFASTLMFAAVCGSPASAQPPAPGADVLTAYNALSACVVAAADRLEPSGESPSDIAVAAEASCETEQVNLAVAESFKDFTEGKLTPEQSAKATQGMFGSMKDKAVAEVVEVRARKNR